MSLSKRLSRYLNIHRSQQSKVLIPSHICNCSQALIIDWRKLSRLADMALGTAIRNQKALSSLPEKKKQQKKKKTDQVIGGYKQHLLVWFKCRKKIINSRRPQEWPTVFLPGVPPAPCHHRQLHATEGGSHAASLVQALPSPAASPPGC